MSKQPGTFQSLCLVFAMALMTSCVSVPKTEIEALRATDAEACEIMKTVLGGTHEAGSEKLVSIYPQSFSPISRPEMPDGPLQKFEFFVGDDVRSLKAKEALRTGKIFEESGATHPLKGGGFDATLSEASSRLLLNDASQSVRDCFEGIESMWTGPVISPRWSQQDYEEVSRSSLITFSPVLTFNNGKRAIVSVAAVCGLECGEGGVYYLVKIRNQWRRAGYFASTVS